MNFLKKHGIISSLIPLILLTLLFIMGEASFKETVTTALDTLPPQTQTAAVSEFNSNLVAHYTFDDTTNDAAGSNHGTPQGGPTYVEGKVGKAISFDGTNSVDIPSTDSLNLSTKTFSFWIKPSMLTGIQGLIQENGYNYGVLLSNSNLQVYWHVAANTPTFRPYAIGLPDVWKHIAITYSVNGSDVTITVYLNGSILNSYNTTSGFTPKGPITGLAHNGAFKFSGLMDDVRIYNRVLSISEISQLYSLGSPATEVDLESEQITNPPVLSVSIPVTPPGNK